MQKRRILLAYSAMRLGTFCLIGLLLTTQLASPQTVRTATATPTPALPEVRPALLGTGPESLINRIDTADLIKKGQKDAAVMFTCLVAPTGEIARSGTYRGTKGSEPLEKEVLKRLASAKFIPAIHNHQAVLAVFYGTVTFAVVNGKPRLRIFANQQLPEVDKETDFIDPQPYVGQDSKFTGTHYPEVPTTVSLTGAVELAVEVDAAGDLKSMQVVSEEPPFLNFGEAAMSDFNGAKFIPAFRDGKPVDSKVTLHVYYKP
ncbi:MAG TPA: energy transducer TonB [Candidatus Udaeobacter sp.]|nr:energy transducer TonB [Candidatus Udaeobacter sp.]